jgi:hypothetical protein
MNCACLSPAARIVRTLGAVKSDVGAALGMMINIHVEALEGLRRDIGAAEFQAAIGPSSAIADYFAIQLGRFGVESASLTQTGLLLADGLHRLRRGDLIVMLAYSRVYRELATLLF